MLAIGTLWLGLIVLSTALGGQAFPTYSPWTNTIGQQSGQHPTAQVQGRRKPILAKKSFHRHNFPSGLPSSSSVRTLSTASDTGLAFAPLRWITKGALLSSVLTRILGASMHPRMWKSHWEKSRKLVLISLCVAQGSTLLTGRLVNPVLLLKVIGSVIALRSYLLPSGYVSLVTFAYLFLGHAGNVRRMLHEAYILLPWWFSNKVMVNDDAEADIPQYLQTLKASPATVALAQEFVQARKGGMDLANATDIAHHCGALVLYAHSFGSAVMTSSDWPHIVMHTCYSRILDDYQDMEEDIRDGNAHRNFFFRLQQQQQYRYGTNGDRDITKQAVVQAMRAMLWHEEQIKNPFAQHYARSFIQAFEVLMLFKNRTFKREWKEARVEALQGATTCSSQQIPPFEWPFQCLVAAETEVAVV